MTTRWGRCAVFLLKDGMVSCWDDVSLASFGRTIGVYGYFTREIFMLSSSDLPVWRPPETM